MADNQVPCEMCCKEKAIGYCNTCGNIGETCVGIHKTGRAFKTHILKMYGKDGYNPRRILYDITEEICKNHPTERALLFCKIHELMICGRCFRSDHISCGHEVVDLCLEANHIDNDQFNAMSAVLIDIKDESKRLKEEVDIKKEKGNTHAVKCNKELDDLENKLKRKVEDSISSFKEDVQKFHEENIATFSCISSICEENVSWAIQEESQLNEFVNNSLTGRLYLMSRNFDKGISKAKKQMKEAEYKNTFKNVCLKENTAALKCLIEDLTDVCELQEEVDGSDEGTTFSIVNATVENRKTRKELIKELIQAKLDKDKAETTNQELYDEINQVKRDLDEARNEFKEQLLQAKRDFGNSEKTREKLSDELLQMKQKLDHSEKTRQELCDELKEIKQDRDNSEKTRKGFHQDLQKAKQDIEKSEMARKGFEQDLRKAKQDIDKSKKTREKLCDELQQVKQKLDHSEKIKAGTEQELLQVKQVWDNSEKTRKKLEQNLQKAKQDIEKSEKIKKGLEHRLLQVQQRLDYSEKLKAKTREKFCDELKEKTKEINKFYDELQQVKQELDHSEKTKKGLEQNLQKAKQDIEKYEKARYNVEKELRSTKVDFRHFKMECTTLQAKCTHLKECIKWTQPTGAVAVKIYREQRFPIKCVFTFPDGIQTKHNPSPGKPYKGGTFTGFLKNDNEGQLVCRMLKVTFRRGLMYTVKQDECVGLDGLLLYLRFNKWLFHSYDEYIQKVKANLAAKGITETNIDITEELEETFTIDGP